jgi:hypothetical protein
MKESKDSIETAASWFLIKSELNSLSSNWDSPFLIGSFMQNRTEQRQYNEQ